MVNKKERIPPRWFNYSLKSSFANRTNVLLGLLSDYLRLYRAIVPGIHTIKKAALKKPLEIDYTSRFLPPLFGLLPIDLVGEWVIPLFL